MNEVRSRKVIPFWLVVLACFSLYASLAFSLMEILRLPWRIPMPQDLGLVLGVLLLAMGFYMYLWSNRSLGLRRALGKELFKSAAESSLIIAGIYAHSRNPMYSSISLLFLGGFCVSRSTPLAMVTIQAIIHFVVVAKWEEKELTRRFGKEYPEYKERVPFFIPSFRNRLAAKR